MKTGDTPIPEPVSFASLVERFDAIFFDAYGVLRGGHGLFPGVPELLARLRNEERPFWIVTNDCSKSPERIAEAYGGLVRPEQVLSTGLLIEPWLPSDKSRVAYLGPEESKGYLQLRGHEVVPFAEAGHDVSLVAIMDEEGWDWKRELDRLVNFARARPEVPIVVPNGDLVFPWRDREVRLAAGAFAALLERVLDRSIPRLGKPAPALFELGLARAQVERGRALVVGDNLATDIAGARAAGIPAALALSGNTSAATYCDEVRRSGVIPDFVVRGVGE